MNVKKELDKKEKELVKRLLDSLSAKDLHRLAKDICKKEEKGAGRSDNNSNEGNLRLCK